MNISYNWLKRYLDTDLSAEEVADDPDRHRPGGRGLREDRDRSSGGLAGVVVGEVLTCDGSSRFGPPASDDGRCRRRARRCRSSAAPPTAARGLKVLCATVGAVLYPDGGDEEFKIKRSKIRGVESLGHALRRGRTGHRSLARRASWSFRPTRVSGTTAREYLQHRGRLPDRDRPDAQPCGCRVAHRRGARSGGLSAKPRASTFR